MGMRDTPIASPMVIMKQMAVAGFLIYVSHRANVGVSSASYTQCIGIFGHAVGAHLKN